MKKQFNVFDAFTVLLTGLFFTDHLNSIFWIVVPWLVELVLFISEAFKVNDRVRFWIFKKVLNQKVKNADRRARKEFGNPGSKENEQYFKTK